MIWICNFQLILWIDVISASHEIGLRWYMQAKHIDDKSSLVNVMDWWNGEKTKPQCNITKISIIHDNCPYYESKYIMHICI